MIYIGIFKSVKNTIKTIIVILFFSFLYGQSNKRDYDEELRYQNEAINSLKKSSYIAATNNGEPISSSFTKKLRFPENFCG